MATKRKDPLDEYLAQNSLESMGFVEETEQERFARPKPPKTEPCPICGHPRMDGKPTCNKPDCAYQFVRKRRKEIVEERKRIITEQPGRILPRVDDIVCEAEVITDRKGK